RTRLHCFGRSSADRVQKLNTYSWRLARRICGGWNAQKEGVPIQRLAAGPFGYSQLKAPPFWYSITRVSKKFFSFFKSIAPDIQGKGFSASSNTGASPSWAQRRLAMKCI